MSKKTIIITWRFNQLKGLNFCDREKISSNYEIIKFYTPVDRDEQITKDLFDKLVGIISEINSDLFVFFHTPNFRNYKNNLTALNKPEQNIHIIPFEGGTGYVYKEFIDQNSKELKYINANSIVKIFKKIEEKYGRLANYKDKLNLLHKCLSPETLKTITDSALEKMTGDELFCIEAFRNNVDTITDPFDGKYVQQLTSLRTSFLAQK